MPEAIVTRILRLQWLLVFEQFGRLLTRHREGLLKHGHEQAPFGTVEAINGNIRAMLRRGGGYRNHGYLLLRVQSATETRGPKPA